MKKLAIIGANEFQKRLVVKSKELNIETHVFAWDEGAIAKDTTDHFYPISITNKDEILGVLQKVGVDGICSIASDLAMPTVNFIARELNLVGNSPDCTVFTTNKFAMRNKLSEEGLPIPKYQLIKKENEIDFNNLEFPVIVKPIDRSGSRGIYKATNRKELREGIKKSLEVSFTDAILIEEFIDGKEFSIEAITQNGLHNILQITEKFTTGAPYFIERAHLCPARVDEEIKILIYEIVEKSLNALKIKNGASHSEIKLSPKGEIKIIEIAARMGGDFIGSDMVQISTGFDFVKGVIDVALKQDIDFNYHESTKIAIVKFIFDDEDIKIMNKLKNDYPYIIKEDYINPKFKNVIDSSTRNGYFIMEMQQSELNQVLTILELDT